MARTEQMGRGDRLTFSEPDGHLYDVVAVSLADHTVRLMDAKMTKPNAEAYVAMAVMRRGCDEEFFAEVPTGAYANGDKWEGRNKAASLAEKVVD